QNNNISAIPIKGPVLAEIVYKDIALREYGDLDILVRKGEYEQAIQLLLTLGYQETNYPSSSNSVWHRKYAHHRTFINERSGVFVEMHWDLTERNPALLEIDKIAPEHLIDIMFGGTTTQVLNPELTLLYLCVHGYRHQWERLSWLCDVAELINTHPNLDW